MHVSPFQMNLFTQCRASAPEKTRFQASLQQQRRIGPRGPHSHVGIILGKQVILLASKRQQVYTRNDRNQANVNYKNLHLTFSMQKSEIRPLRPAKVNSVYTDSPPCPHIHIHCELEMTDPWGQHRRWEQVRPEAGQIAFHGHRPGSTCAPDGAQR